MNKKNIPVFLHCWHCCYQATSNPQTMVIRRPFQSFLRKCPQLHYHLHCSVTRGYVRKSLDVVLTVQTLPFVRLMQRPKITLSIRPCISHCVVLCIQAIRYIIIKYIEIRMQIYLSLLSLARRAVEMVMMYMSRCFLQT